MYIFLNSVVRLVIFFFFSSRRRHTRCSRDWSSDVCSSDLEKRPQGLLFWSERPIKQTLRPLLSSAKDRRHTKVTLKILIPRPLCGRLRTMKDRKSVV